MLQSQRRASYELGLLAEEVVVKYISNAGYIILARRYKTKYGEIDIIAANDDELLFLEVKGRKTAPDLDSIINPTNLQRHRDAISCFLASNQGYENMICRLDLVIVCQGKVVAHVRNIG